MNRGATLLEVVVSLALLASLMLVLTSWTRLVGAVDGVGGDARWRVAAEALLDRIHEDVLVGDFESAPDDRCDRVRVEAGELVVHTRRTAAPGGPVLHAYALEDDDATIVARDELPAVGRRRGPRGEGHVVLGDVAAFETALDDESGVLLVQVSSVGGTRLDRRIAIR